MFIGWHCLLTVATASNYKVGIQMKLIEGLTLNISWTNAATFDVFDKKIRCFEWLLRSRHQSWRWCCHTTTTGIYVIHSNIVLPLWSKIFLSPVLSFPFTKLSFTRLLLSFAKYLQHHLCCCSQACCSALSLSSLSSLATTHNTECITPQQTTHSVLQCNIVTYVQDARSTQHDTTQLQNTTPQASLCAEEVDWSGALLWAGCKKVKISILQTS